VVAWGSLWTALLWLLGGSLMTEAAGLAALLLGLGIFVAQLRVRWRPVTGCVGLAVSRRLRPGDRAWYVRPRGADLVLLTARHGARVIIARPDLGGGEGLSVRRTRVFLLPADPV
jgi:hypothetical protein